MFAFKSKSLIFIAGLSLISGFSGFCRGNDKPEYLEKFLSNHCYECHGSKEQEGEIRLDNLELDLTNQESIEIWQLVLDQLNLNEMPPQKKPRPDPLASDRVVSFLTENLARAYRVFQSTERQTVLRRLNRHELRNTLRDLLFLKGPDFEPGARASKLVDNNGNGSVESTGTDPLRFFPEDENDEGFVNIGNHLVMSDFLLKLTMDAVEESLLRTIHLGPKPILQSQHFNGQFIKGRVNGEHPVETISREMVKDHEKLVVGYDRYGRFVPTELRRGVSQEANYRISLEVSAHNPEHPWTGIIPSHRNIGFELSLSIASTSRGGIAGPTSRNLKVWRVPADGRKHRFTLETWLDKGWTPWIGWENGPDSKVLRVDRIVEQFYPDKYFKRPDKKTNKEGHDNWTVNLAKVLLNDGYRGPHIKIHSLAIEPLIEEWPPKSHKALFGMNDMADIEVEKLVRNFAFRAFRRPVEDNEIEPYLSLLQNGDSVSGNVMQEGIKEMEFRFFLGDWNKLPDFDHLAPVMEGKNKLGFIDISKAPAKEKFGAVFSGMIETAVGGEYLFKMASDDGARIRINDQIVLEHDGLHGAVLKQKKIRLSQGMHKIRVEYFAYGQPNSFRATWGLADGNQVRISKEGFEQPRKENRVQGLPPRIRNLMNVYSAIMCSPQFLYLEENEEDLTHYNIASRLSYFLWSSMPDEQLIRMAEEKKLQDREVLVSEVERMLKDPRADAFSVHFPSAWLRLDKLGKMPPSGGEYQFYRNVKIEPMLAEQVTRYFRDMLAANSPVEEFVDSDFTYMNHPLAKWIYRREGIRGHVLKRVEVDSRRGGGIFTLPGLMTATANGVDTSPVVRGSWVLENILGTPPAPPPPDVEPLPTDTRLAKTIRDQLELHRKHAACNNCHQKIDPIGFPFENFDVVGRWRDQYKTSKTKVDPSSILSNGKAVGDILDFKKYLMEKKELVIRCLTEKMLIYAIGRKLEALDRGEVDRIVKELAGRKNRLRDLVCLVATSDVFLSK